ncbi:DUF6302 family protein [Streptomyces uncialis]|uniref:DUF6302 family protein n=1 Tax=Streptomyces uncialis TaxID=1048205 RepID=UPI003864BEBC|nr:DUF6302 family protein [Streptomyces uncialis]
MPGSRLVSRSTAAASKNRRLWATDLAVPVGGRRSGGFLSVAEPTTGIVVRNLLRDQRGVPEARLRWSAHLRVSPRHPGGTRAPHPDDDETIGRFHGYRDRATALFKAAGGAR